MMIPHGKIATLLQWCCDQNIRIDPRLEIGDTATGIGVFSRDDCHECPTTLVTIPKRALLSVRSCSLSKYITSIPYGHGAHLALALGVYGELISGEASRWFGYLQSLPAEIVDLALFWGVDGECMRYDQEAIEDSKRARAWTAGTEVENELRNKETGVDLLAEINHYYATIAEPLLTHLNLPTSFGGYYHAYSLVSSRAFLVDAYHGLAMVPIADAFNHAQENHVHLESDHHVCVVCGSLAECPHDAQDTETNADERGLTSFFTATIKFPTRNPVLRPSTSSHIDQAELPRSRRIEPHPEDEENTCDMVSNLPILSGTEVFNTYGEHLTNAYLLVRYGFFIDGNEWDCVRWNLHDLRARMPDCARSPPASVSNETDELLHLWTRIGSKWPSYDGWAESNLVHNSPRLIYSNRVSDYGPTESEALDVGRSKFPDGRGENISGNMEGALYVNEDGKITHHLWLYCALVAMRDDERWKDLESNLQGALWDLADAQVNTERKMYPDEDEGMPYDSDGYDLNAGNILPRGGQVSEANNNRETLLVGNGFENGNALNGVLSNLVRTVTSLCRNRSGKMEQASGISCSEVGDILDTIPVSMHRTRLAVMQVMSEKSLLETCISAWAELGASVNAF